ncbi:MAG TPA: CinA family protein [Xanthobacteraceae bacterium]|nr:CinA family protein [Xanthobacteraceae bacterium]
MQSLLPLAEKIGARLIARKEKIAIAEGSAGGLISAALLAVPGASAYFLGGNIVYTIAARRLVGISDEDMKGIRAASEPYALLLARRVRDNHGAAWGLSETGAAGPTGNRYGDPAGHTCIGIVGTSERAVTLRTGSADRQTNMRAFALRALEVLAETLDA